MADTNDLLGEALAKCHERFLGEQLPEPEDVELIMAAARNWHTLTNPETVERIAKAIQPWIAVDPATEHEWPLAQLYNARVAAAVVVDALTVTADE